MNMVQTLGYVALVVRDYDDAIAFFTEKLGFELVEDSVATDRLGEKKRAGYSWLLRIPLVRSCF
jgi:catechol 2,3-dioxygenase-like lactoylglutathione lyase family enzyme